MKTLVKKEIRLLLPNFLAACGLTASIFLLPHKTPELLGLSAFQWVLPCFICPALAVMLALSSFGGEMSAGTFSTMLAQPVPRQKIWETKICLLAASLLILGVLWSGFSDLWLAWTHRSSELLDWITNAAIFGLVVFTGGLWTVLLLRQVAAAFWFTVLVPAAMWGGLGALLGDQPPNFVEGVVVIVLGVYSLAGFFFARWLFWRAQDAQWSGGAVIMPEMRGLAWSRAGVAERRVWRPRAALILKELQLHQAQFVIAGVLVVLHLAVDIARHLGHFQRNSTTLFVLDGFWFLWFAMPLLIGSAAVAEERKLGTHEGHLYLPVHRRTQFSVKLLVTLGLSVLFGLLLPLLLEGPKILPNLHMNMVMPDGWEYHASTAKILFLACLETFNGLLPLLTMAGLVMLIGGVPFYVSTLTRNTLQTLAPAVVAAVLACFLAATATVPWRADLGFLWHGPLVYFIALPVMVVTLLMLAYGNFQRVFADGKLIRVNLLALACTLAFATAATSAIYHRAWEKFTAFEPPHGAPRLNLPNAPDLANLRDEVTVRLPDGRIWAARFSDNVTGFKPFSILFSNFKAGLLDGRFANGLNWISLNRTSFGLVGLKADGTLWVSDLPCPRLVYGQEPFEDYSRLKPLTQFGSDTNWSNATPYNNFVLLVKSNGTLWRWGPTNFDLWHTPWPGLQAFTPQRLGTGTNWAAVYPGNYYSEINLRQTDGSVWRNWSGSTNGQKTLELEPGFVVGSTHVSRSADFRSAAEIQFNLPLEAGVQGDGTFRIGEEYQWIQNQHSGDYYEWRAAYLPIGAGTNWLAVAGNGNNLVTLKNDGTLWVWKFRVNSVLEQEQELPPEEYQRAVEHAVVNTAPERLGIHSDWIAIAGSYNSVVSLAADGSLWYWPLEAFDEDDSNFPELLDVSRKPQYLGNIFNRANSAQPL